MQRPPCGLTSIQDTSDNHNYPDPGHPSWLWPMPVKRHQYPAHLASRQHSFNMCTGAAVQLMTMPREITKMIGATDLSSGNNKASKEIHLPPFYLKHISASSAEAFAGPAAWIKDTSTVTIHEQTLSHPAAQAYWLVCAGVHAYKTNYPPPQGLKHT